MREKYRPGLFDPYLVEKDLDLWEGFPELMLDLGYEMDCEHSFDVYRKSSKLKQKEGKADREEKRNILYLLEHADLQIVGNYLFSHWRYLIHWAYSYDEYDVDFLKRIIAILEAKYMEL